MTYTRSEEFAWGTTFLTKQIGRDCPIDEPPKAVETLTCTDQTIIDQCEPIKSDIFKSCDSQPEINRNDIYDHCVFDICHGASDRCTALNEVANACFNKLGDTITKDDDMCTWADKYNCAPVCQANSSYSLCAKTCEIKTCGNRNPVCDASSKMISMCVCDNGYLMKDGSCVKASACGCTLENGMTVSEGYVYNEECKKTCTCKDGEVTCVDDTASCKDECALGTDNCDVNAECEDRRNGFKCICKSGFTGNGVKCESNKPEGNYPL